jgi:hypothetical protein
MSSAVSKRALVNALGFLVMVYLLYFAKAHGCIERGVIVR